MAFEVRFVGREGFELEFEPEFILLLPLPQLQLLLYHCLLLLSHDHHLCIQVLLLLDGGIGMSLSYGL
jgi:hypothetical protein